MVDNSELHPLFWDEVPETAESDPSWQALEALKEESTPEERAENFKLQANNKLKFALKARKKVYLREAINFYTQGLALKCDNPKLNSVLLSNRAHVESLLGNWRNCLQDSQEARKLDPSNVKAYFRSAKAALQLGQHALCVQLCKEGQAVDSKAPEFASMIKEAQQKEAEEAAKQQQLEAQREAELAPFRRLVDAILSRGWRVTLPQVRLESGSRPSLDDAQQLHWPVLIIYPENMQQDAIQDFVEHDTVAAHLDVMFGPEAPPLEWDARKEYTRKSIELYYLSHAGTPLDRDQLVEAMQGKWPEDLQDVGPKRYGDKAAKWTLVDQKLSLGQVLSKPDYVIPGIPLFFAVAKGTAYRQRFLEEELNRFK